MKEKETIEYLDLKHLVPFRNHPFKLRNGEEKEQLLKSIKAQGTIEPLIVRPLSESEYEVISGHRRMEICKELGIEKLPVIVRNLTDEQAVSMMVDANLHRENILPSERAFAYKMKWEAIRKQAQRTDLTLSQPATKYRSDERIANEFGIGKDTLHRYIRLTYLIPELLEMVDEGRLTADVIFAVMSEEKPTRRSRFGFQKRNCKSISLKAIRARICRIPSSNCWKSGSGRGNETQGRNGKWTIK